MDTKRILAPTNFSLFPFTFIVGYFGIYVGIQWTAPVIGISQHSIWFVFIAAIAIVAVVLASCALWLWSIRSKDSGS